MFKMLLTLARGQAAAAEESFADRNALLILDQQMRDAAGALDRARKALAIAIAQENAEKARLEGARARIADLEARVVEALKAGAADLAREGAEAIAALEADRDAVAGAQGLFGPQIAQLRRQVVQAEARLADLERGRRLARASEAVRRLRDGVEAAPSHEASLADAERTLRRLREKQSEAAAADAALKSLEPDGSDVAEKLAARGFGPRLKPSADDVLDRLKARAAEPA